MLYLLSMACPNRASSFYINIIISPKGLGTVSERMRHGGRRQAAGEAQQALLASLAAFPCNWDAWRALRAAGAAPDFFQALNPIYLVSSQADIDTVCILWRYRGSPVQFLYILHHAAQQVDPDTMSTLLHQKVLNKVLI